MKARNIAYWITTGLLGGLFLLGGFSDLGAAAVLAPRTALLKEWAYAGMFFDLTGAAASHAASGDPLSKVLIPVLLTGLAVASWALRPSSRRLPGTRLAVERAREAALSPA